MYVSLSSLSLSIYIQKRIQLDKYETEVNRNKIKIQDQIHM